MPRPIVIGGGVAGSAAAIHLLAAGASPLIIERSGPEADGLCGGFLSWRTLGQIERLGISPAALGGPWISRLRLVCGTRQRTAPLPGAAMALSRRRLDSLLRARAEALGAEVIHDTARFEDGAVRLAGGGELRAESLFLATGKHELPGLARPRDAAGGDPMLGLRLRLPGDAARTGGLGGHIEMHLFAGGYAGAVLQEDGTLNLCLAVAKSRLAAAGGSPLRLMEELAGANPLLALRLGALPPGQRIDAVGRVPYGWRAREGTRGIFRLGDQAGVIPSLAGEGIGIALASARLAVRHWAGGGGAAAPAYQRAMAAALARPLRIAGMVAGLGGSPAGAAALVQLMRVPGLPALLGAATRIG